MPKLLDYGTEIRMYSWGLFFVTGGLLAAWYTARTARSGGLGWGAGDLRAAGGPTPTTLPAWRWRVAYLALLVWQLVRRDRRGLVRWGIAAAVTVAAYLPWLFVLLAQLRTVQGNYWIEPITLQTVQGYGTFLFGSGSLWVAVALVAVLWLTTRPRGADGLCIAAALLCPFWTIAVGLVASAVVRPVFVARYLVPELGCLWAGGGGGAGPAAPAADQGGGAGRSAGHRLGRYPRLCGRPAIPGFRNPLHPGSAGHAAPGRQAGIHRHPCAGEAGRAV